VVEESFKKPKPNTEENKVTEIKEGETETTKKAFSTKKVRNPEKQICQISK